ncbi:MAG TPA: AMP-binding protein [Steroidobacteraceae bacterium]|nr:AMP-binding protein [Steroidobacteraceae bacterium]
MVAYRAGRPILVPRFLADVERVAAILGASSHVLNACADRYHFSVGFAASLLSGKVSLLPSTYTPEAVRQLSAFAPDAVCLTDEDDCPLALPLVRYPRADTATPPPSPPRSDAAGRVPRVDAAQLAAYVFTSGSTGTPVPYRKSWGRLVDCVREEGDRFGLRQRAPCTIVATVPPQHMYGFESSVLLALCNGHALCAERPFYPADIAAVLAGVPRARVLVSTPVHLRAILSSGVVLPQTDLIVSSTAPLAQQLAAETEQRNGTELLEIYGSTETGQIAVRRPTHGPEWRLWPGVRLTLEGDATLAQGGHIEQPTRMCDVLELTAQGRFLLHGRLTDLVNIAGKRSSLAYLNHHLNSIPGVEDGAFFHLEESRSSQTGVARLAACVVAPSLDAQRLLEALRERIDAVFLPRPLLLVARLPRNSTGKLPQEALRALAARARSAPARTALTIPAEHPALAGHFPGIPVLPGVLLLDEVVRMVESDGGLCGARWRIGAAKFVKPVRPGETLTLGHEPLPNGSIRFKILRAGQPVAHGVLVPLATQERPDHGRQAG